jgi:hypothetical protein
MPGVALHPTPVDLVLAIQFEQSLPQVLIGDRLAAFRFPAFTLPVFQPALLEGVLEVHRIGVQLHTARLFESGECMDRSGQFHAVVGGIKFRTGKLAAMVVCVGDQHCAPAPGSGIRGARTIGVDFNLWFHGLPCASFILSIIENASASTRQIL